MIVNPALIEHEDVSFVGGTGLKGSQCLVGCRRRRHRRRQLVLFSPPASVGKAQRLKTSPTFAVAILSFQRFQAMAARAAFVLLAAREKIEVKNEVLGQLQKKELRKLTCRGFRKLERGSPPSSSP